MMNFNCKFITQRRKDAKMFGNCLIKTLRFSAFFAVCIHIIFTSCKTPESDGSHYASVSSNPDVYNWKTASWIPFTDADMITGFAYGTPDGRDRYIAVAASGVIGWSDNCDIWHRALKAPDDPDNPGPNPFDAQFNAAAWGGGIFVAVGNNGRIARSADGIHWSAGGHTDGITGFGTTNIMGISWGKGMFVAVGGNSNAARSSDGIIWQGGQVAGFGGDQLNDIAFDSAGSRFYIVGNNGKRGWSDDPASGWTYIEPDIRSNPNDPDIPAVAPFQDNDIRKVTIGRYGSDIGIGIVFDEWGGWRTSISVNNNFIGFDSHLDAGNFGNNAINGIAWAQGPAGGHFVAAGSAAMIGWWPSDQPSNNGDRFWRADSFSEFQWWEITALAAMNGRFFAGNRGGKIGYSK